MATEDAVDLVNHEATQQLNFHTVSPAHGAEGPAICVICLERLSDFAATQPCKHRDFHFSCLCTWLNQSPYCPLCKTQIRAVRRRDQNEIEIYQLLVPSEEPLRTQHRRRPRECQFHEPVDSALEFRKQVYEHGTFSYWVANNAYTGYRNIDHNVITNDSELVSKAKIWIRRELRVFDFLDPDSPSFGRRDRRATNAEYLLEYIVSVIKAINIKGSAGQAEELIGEFLGRANAMLFLHELENWLRSPFTRVHDWDKAVQYYMPGRDLGSI